MYMKNKKFTRTPCPPLILLQIRIKNEIGCSCCLYDILNCPLAKYPYRKHRPLGCQKLALLEKLS